MKDEELILSKMPLLTPKLISVITNQILDKLQYKKPEEQLIASAVLFIMLCNKFNISSFSNVLSIAHNYLFDETGTNHNFRGIERFLKRRENDI